MTAPATHADGNDSELTTGDDRSDRPMLFVDTASLLDLVRKIDRSRDDVEIRRDAQRLLDIVVRREIELLLPEQVVTELDRNLETVESESRKTLEVHLKVHQAIDAYLEALGLPIGGAIPMSGQQRGVFLDNVAAVRRTSFDRWRGAATEVRTTDDAMLRALRRTNARVAPAHDGKPEFADCLIIESVFGEFDERRRRGDKAAAVFLTADTSDYGGIKGGSIKLRPPLDTEFAQRHLACATTFGLASHLLGCI